ncbi:hypothetical protein LTR49_028924, partial [Elasticomyces elasticus]
MRYSNCLENIVAWMDGPYGLPYHLEHHGWVLLFASGTGIFAQLHLIKRITEQTNIAAARTKRVKLVWLTEMYHNQFQDWMQGILDDDDLDME